MVTSSIQPSRFLVIGSGRLAVHLMHYLKILNARYTSWNRRQARSELLDHLQQSTHVLLAISDSALESFFQENLQSFGGKVIHFSGALEFANIIGVHPLMSFGTELYAEEIYRTIPLITSSSLELQEILPGFANALFRIAKKDKSYYHALCVIGGNLTTLLVQKMLSGFAELNLPQHIAEPYLQQIIKNVLTNPEQALTGPLARKDFSTIEKNLQSLSGDAFAEVYKAFIPIAIKETQP